MHPNDPRLRSFVPVHPESHFPIQNLPFGIFQPPGQEPRAGVAIGDLVVDLAALESAGLLDVARGGLLARPVLNDFIALGRTATSAVRTRVSELLRSGNPTLRDDALLRDKVFHALKDVTLCMPVSVGGFSDFMLSREHSLNCVDIVGGSVGGQIWRNWTYLPMAYNGRASSVVVSGTPVKRPRGQVLDEGQTAPRYQPTAKLDFELEAALVIGRGNELGSTVAIEDADAHMFGVVLLNDWSTRDIQAWEAQPLGVFVSKSHRTSISPWIVTFDALEPFRADGPEQHPPPLAYLDHQGPRNFNVYMEASIRPEGHAKPSVVCRSNMQALYWSFAQQVAHHTSTGCNLMPGDLLGTGTVSASGPNAQGCLYEATRDGRQGITLEHGGTRTYLHDGDEVVLTAWAQGQGYRVGFGECTGRIMPVDEGRSVSRGT
jgi:fumarylacetoacetase